MLWWVMPFAALRVFAGDLRQLRICLKLKSPVKGKGMTRVLCRVACYLGLRRCAGCVPASLNPNPTPQTLNPKPQTQTPNQFSLRRHPVGLLVH